MARLAYRLKLPLARIRIPYAEGEVWPVAQVLDVMHYHRAAVSVSFYTALAALAVIEPQHLRPHRAPLRPPVKRLLTPLSNQLAELSEAAIAYRRHRPLSRTATLDGRIYRTARGTLSRSSAAHTLRPGSRRGSERIAGGCCLLCAWRRPPKT